MKTIKFALLILVLSTHVSQGQWERVNFPRRWPHTLLQTTHGLLVADDNTFFRSTDNGTTWDSISSVYPVAVSRIIQIGDVLLATTARGWAGDPFLVPSVYRSTNFGNYWEPVMLAKYGGSSIVFFDSKAYLDLDGRLYFSNDTGSTWSRMTSDSTFHGYAGQLVNSGQSLYCQVAANELYRSDDAGLTWAHLNTHYTRNYYCIVGKDPLVFIGTFDGGCISSTDQGFRWNKQNLGLPDSSGFTALRLYENSLIASVLNLKNLLQSVYIYQISEGIWHNFSEGLPSQGLRTIYEFTTSDDYIFLGSDSTVWRRPLSQWITGVQETKTEILPAPFLFENFPNPFNPETSISFIVPQRDLTSLKIYDQLGREIETLFDGIINPGMHHFQWNAARFSSGFYFARLCTGSYSQTRKLVLLK